MFYSPLIMCVSDIFHNKKLKSQREMSGSWSSIPPTGGAEAEPVGPLPLPPSLRCWGLLKWQVQQETELATARPAGEARNDTGSPGYRPRALGPREGAVNLYPCMGGVKEDLARWQTPARGQGLLLECPSAPDATVCSNSRGGSTYFL